ncbi:MAG: hypothetical protein QOG03_1801 [Actinomycetota bacterium]|nr:hypothetical protein [Actinomycetota bacterium]
MDNAVQAFLTNLIDDAGLFPPATLPMDEAVAGHVAAKASSFGWIMDRFVCSSSRLDELEAALPPEVADEPWDLAVVADGDFDPTVDRPGLVLRLVETRGLPDFDPHPSIEVFCEQVDIGTCLENGHGAKIRCGGATADLYPSPGAVAAFVAECAQLGVRMKATAGLHHPVRAVDPATGITNHGFLNVVGAAVLAHGGTTDEAILTALVAEEDPAAFTLNHEIYRWRDLAANAAQIADARRELFVGIGSCSFTEPVGDLVSLGMLS